MGFNGNTKQMGVGYNDRTIDTTRSIHNPDTDKRKVFIAISGRAKA